MAEIVLDANVLVGMLDAGDVHHERAKALVERLRDALLDGSLALQWGDAVALGVALALFLGGRWVFHRLSPHFEDFL